MRFDVFCSRLPPHLGLYLLTGTSNFDASQQNSGKQYGQPFKGSSGISLYIHPPSADKTVNASLVRS